ASTGLLGAGWRRFRTQGWMFILTFPKWLCEFEGRRFSLGESWMDDSCMQCTCLYPVGVGCCETVQRPVDFPAWCQVRVERVSCTVSLVQTADPRLPWLGWCPRPPAPPRSRL
uniref:Prostate-associated microseminoprotein n=1 Tax=Cynoglossus semilaevis TaxID=244447 RepID=A0A3P8UZX0_CYNSE